VLVAIICGTAVAQDVSFMSSSGVGFKSTDRTLAVIQDLRVLMQISPKILTVGKIHGSVEPSQALQGYGVGGEIAFLASNRVTVHVSGSYIRADTLTDNDLSPDKIEASAGIFQAGVKWWFTDLTRDNNEAIGLGAAGTFDELTQDYGIFVSLEVWFGRRAVSP
jgi:hypothetical protein